MAGPEITVAVRRILEDAFRDCPDPTRSELRQVAERAQLTSVQTSQWFRTKRHRSKTAAVAAAVAEARRGVDEHVSSAEAARHQELGQLDAQLAELARVGRSGGIEAQHERAALVWTELQRQFTGMAPANGPPTPLITMDACGRVLFAPVFASHTGVDAGVRSRIEAGNPGELDEGLLLGLRRVFEQHRQYFVALAPFFLAANQPAHGMRAGSSFSGSSNGNGSNGIGREEFSTPGSL